MVKYRFFGAENKMEEVNALKLRNNLGEILDRLRDKGEPILVNKGRKLRAVLVTPEQFERRFLDWQAAEQRQRFLKNVAQLKKNTISRMDSLTVLRQLRGYD